MQRRMMSSPIRKDAGNLRIILIAVTTKVLKQSPLRAAEQIPHRRAVLLVRINKFEALRFGIALHW
jgi:hypothetical protein